MDKDTLLEYLHAKGLIRARHATITPLTGGVSSEILLIDDGEKKLVVKRALPKLKVKDDWFADVSRNNYEQLYIRYVGTFLPDAVPKVHHSDPENGFFVMEYLGEGYVNWKQDLLAGNDRPAWAGVAGAKLGLIHNHSWRDDTVRRAFQTDQNFHQLRIEPYLVTTGDRHPSLREHFHEEARRLAATHLCLVHGDYSPKNILFGHPKGMVILDCEVAWFGDPAFDLAFLFNHFLLKSLYHTPALGKRAEIFVNHVSAAWQSYALAMKQQDLDALQARTARLLLMLLLARIDGKSPVEYLPEEWKKNLVRSFVDAELPDPPRTLRHVTLRWRDRVLGATAEMR